MASTSTDRSRLKRQRDKEAPDRKYQKLDLNYKFDGVDVFIIKDDNENVWLKGVDVARALEMENPTTTITEYINKEYCKTYEELSNYLNAIYYYNIPNMHPKTTFVNVAGIYSFTMRSRKPKAEPFAEWFFSKTLPSIYINNQYETDESKNFNRDSNEHFVKKIEELENQIEKQNEDLEKQTKKLNEQSKKEIEKQKEMEKQKEIIENQIEEIKEFKKQYKKLEELLEKEKKDRICREFTLNSQLSQLKNTQKSSCVQELKNKEKTEYFIIFQIGEPGQDKFPYYACRIQKASYASRYKKLRSQYPEIKKLMQLWTPNCVNYYNLMREKMPSVILRGEGQCFNLKGMEIQEFMSEVEALHLKYHNGKRDKNTYIKDWK